MKCRFATFNLYQYAEPPKYWYERVEKNTYKPADWEAKKTWIKGQLVAMGADVVGFQEVFSPESLKALAADAGYPHFETVDTPAVNLENPDVFDGPVVAIASKYPIASAKAVPVAPTVHQDLPLPERFGFSRTPLKATIAVEGCPTFTVYVAHLKSKRPMVNEPVFEEGTPWDIKVRESMRSTSRGQAASLLQRGAEAAALYHEVTRHLVESADRPVVVLGDFNDDEESIPIEALTSRGRVYEVAGVKFKELPVEAQRAIYANKLFDTFFLAPNQEGGVRPPTHCHMGHDGTLDYIFVSNALNTKNHASVGSVTDFAVYGEHLKGDGVGDHKQSDHGQVVAEVSFS